MGNFAIQVFEDFLTYPEARREEALHSDFQVYHDNGAIFPGIHTTNHIEDLVRLEKHPYFDFSKITCLDFFRLTRAIDILPTYIHTDIAMAELTGILYLNPDSFTAGTRFWKHKESGLTNLPTLEQLKTLGPEYPKKLELEGKDESKWECVETIHMRFNRLVLFDAKLFHSPYPQEGWGMNTQDSRLIQVYFIRNVLHRHLYFDLPGVPDETI